MNDHTLEVGCRVISFTYHDDGSQSMVLDSHSPETPALNAGMEIIVPWPANRDTEPRIYARIQGRHVRKRGTNIVAIIDHFTFHAVGATTKKPMARAMTASPNSEYA
jgi:hypothetical protein